MQAFIRDEIEKSIATFQTVLADQDLLDKVETVANRLTEIIQQGGKVMFAGNGGSAADSQHMAAELVSRLRFDRPGLAAIALTTDTSALTAIGNDYGYEQVFSRQLEAIGNEGDALIAISTSGSSPNIVRLLEAARQKKIMTVGLTSNRQGSMLPHCDVALEVPHHETPKVQEAHILLCHIICAAIESKCFDRPLIMDTKASAGA